MCRLGICRSKSLPLMRKTFIEARTTRSMAGGMLRLFRLCGRLSLRLSFAALMTGTFKSLPLMRKTFIEAISRRDRPGRQSTESLPLMRKTFIEAAEPPKPAGKGSSVSSAYAEDFH